MSGSQQFGELLSFFEIEREDREQATANDTLQQPLPDVTKGPTRFGG